MRNLAVCMLLLVGCGAGSPNPPQGLTGDNDPTVSGDEDPSPPSTPSGGKTTTSQGSDKDTDKPPATTTPAPGTGAATTDAGAK